MSGEVWILKRRGHWGRDGCSAIIVTAETEAHARVVAADKARDMRWGEGGYTSCRKLRADDVISFPDDAAHP